MDFVVTTLIPHNEAFEFTHFLPKSVELEPGEEWLVGVTEFVHNEIYSSAHTLTTDSIVFKKINVKTELDLNKFAKHILNHSKNPMFYGVDYLGDFIQRKTHLVEYVDAKYQAIKQEAGETKQESGEVNPEAVEVKTEADTFLKIKSSGTLTHKELQKVFNESVKPPAYKFLYDKEYTLHEIFLELMGQTLAYIRGLDKEEEAEKHLENLLRIFILEFRAEKQAFLLKNSIPSHDLFVTIHSDIVEPSIVDNMYENFLYFGTSKIKENREHVIYHKVARKYSTLIRRGDRFAQIIVEKAEFPELQEVKSMADTKRGASGFGSSGDREEMVDGSQALDEDEEPASKAMRMHGPTPPLLQEPDTQVFKID